MESHGLVVSSLSFLLRLPCPLEFKDGELSVRGWWSFLQGCRWLLPCRHLRRYEPAIFLMLKRVKRVIKVLQVVHHGKWLFHLQCEVMNVM